MQEMEMVALSEMCQCTYSTMAYMREDSEGGIEQPKLCPECKNVSIATLVDHFGS